jgi:hypothetical protein
VAHKLNPNDVIHVVTSQADGTASATEQPVTMAQIVEFVQQQIEATTAPAKPCAGADRGDQSQ